MTQPKDACYQGRADAMESTESAVTRTYRNASIASLGLEMGLAVIVGFGIGYWLDGQLGTGPWLMLVFLGLGVAAGFKALLRAGQLAQGAKSIVPKPTSADAGADTGAPFSMTTLSMETRRK